MWVDVKGNQVSELQLGLRWSVTVSYSAKLTGNKRICFLKDILSSSYHIFLNCEIFNYVSGSLMNLL